MASISDFLDYLQKMLNDDLVYFFFLKKKRSLVRYYRKILTNSVKSKLIMRNVEMLR